MARRFIFRTGVAESDYNKCYGLIVCRAVLSLGGYFIEKVKNIGHILFLLLSFLLGYGL